MQIGKNILEFREAQNLTVESMAKGLNISVEEYVDIENDKTDLTIKQLEAIARILSVELVDLILFNEPFGGIKNFFFNHNGNAGVNINIQGIDQEQIRKAYKELYKNELDRIPKLEKVIRDHNIDIDF